jgi:hypothetical protein
MNAEAALAANIQIMQLATSCWTSCSNAHWLLGELVWSVARLSSSSSEHAHPCVRGPLPLGFCASCGVIYAKRLVSLNVSVFILCALPATPALWRGRT